MYASCTHTVFHGHHGLLGYCQLLLLRRSVIIYNTRVLFQKTTRSYVINYAVILVNIRNIGTKLGIHNAKHNRQPVKHGIHDKVVTTAIAWNKQPLHRQTSTIAIDIQSLTLLDLIEIPVGTKGVMVVETTKHYKQSPGRW